MSLGWKPRRDEWNAIRLVQLEDEGSSPPEPADGARGWLRWHGRHVPSIEEFAQLLTKLEADELLTSDDVAAYRGRAPADSVAELTARINAIDDIAHARQQSEPS